MSLFFLFVELSSYVFAIYLLLKKKELAIVYLPVIIFASNMVEPVLPASVYYLTFSLLVFSLIFKNPGFYKYNLPAIALFTYFLLLLPRSEDLEFVRPYVFSVLCLFIVIASIGAIYHKYTREKVLSELANAAKIILVLFVINVLMATANKYVPLEMYGITTGILYGNIYAAGFNVLSIAIFITTLDFIQNKKIISFVLIIITLSFLILSLRRSAMGMSLLAVAIPYMTLLTKEKAKMLFLAATLTLVAGAVIYFATDLADLFMERYELRRLDERELNEEKRFLEYELLYKDMFVYRDYSPLIGYELFNSWGHYGRGIMEDRSLHGDLTNITHSSGLIGLALYLMMVFTAFNKALSAAGTRVDKLTIAFCALAFIVYTITGRYTETASTIMLYLLLLLPLAGNKMEPEESLNRNPQSKIPVFKSEFSSSKV